MAKKRQTRPAPKKTSGKQKTAPKRPAKTTAKAAPRARTAAPAPRATASARPAAPLIERAERLRDDILRSKHTHPDPWAYGAKARPWGERVQVLVAQIAVTGDTEGSRRALEALDAEVQRDRDYREARRLF